MRLCSTQNTFLIALSRSTKGRSRSSRTRDGMRWTRMAPLTNGAERGRRSRVVLMPRRWRQVLRKQSDGDNKARPPGRSRRKPLKPSRAGMPDGPGEPTVTTSCALYPILHARLRVHQAPGIPHALLGRKLTCTTRAHSRRENENAYDLLPDIRATSREERGWPGQARP